MKKLLLIMMSLAAVAVACNKGGGENNENKEPEGPKYRIKTLSYTEGDNLKTAEDAEWFDTWTYSYDDQGRVSNVTRGSDDKDWTFAYNDKTVTVTRKSDQAVVMTLTLNDNGVCTAIKDEWNETSVFEYDATLRPTKITKEGELRSIITLRDNCLVSWTKERDNRTRAFTYSTVKNLGDLHAIYSEAVDPPARWMYETGLFGKGPAYLPITSGWTDDPDTQSSLTCSVDENGYCICEVKVFGGGWTEMFVITWEEIK